MGSQPTNSEARPRFLMCRPQYYAVSYSINPWMDPQGWAAHGSDLGEAAHREWAALHTALVDKGATIECVDPKPDPQIAHASATGARERSAGSSASESIAIAPSGVF